MIIISNWPAYLLVLFSDSLGLFVPLKPHHVLGVEPPRLLLERFGGQVLGFRALQIVEDEEQRLGRQAVKEVQVVRRQRNRLWIIRRCRVGRPR